MLQNTENKVFSGDKVTLTVNGGNGKVRSHEGTLHLTNHTSESAQVTFVANKDSNLKKRVVVVEVPTGKATEGGIELPISGRSASKRKTYTIA